MRAPEQTLTCSPSDAVRQRVHDAVTSLPASDRIPMRDGDRAFAEPWELRALSIAIALSDAGKFEWSTFQSALIESIQRWEREQPHAEWRYYDHVAAALESVMELNGWADEGDIDDRTAEVLATPANKDHQHASYEPVAVG